MGKRLWHRRSSCKNQGWVQIDEESNFFVGVKDKLWYDGSNEILGKEISSWPRQQGPMSIW